MNFVLSPEFLVGLVVGALVYHLWMMKKASGNAG